VSSAVLVTGGTGHIGSRVARSLLERGKLPILFDLVPNMGNVRDIVNDVQVEVGDVTEISDLLRAIRRTGAESVIHLGALLTLQVAARPPRGIATNCIGTANVFEVAQALDLRRVVWTSSAAVFGPTSRYEALLGRTTMLDEDPPMPEDLYGSTKYLCEVLSRQYLATGTDIVGLRPVMSYGSGTFSTAVGILNAAIREIAYGRPGTVTHPWSRDARVNSMYVDDMADLIVRACLHDKRLGKPVYNTGMGEYLSIGEMMDLATSLVPGSKIEFASDPALADQEAAVPHFYYPDLDSSALRAELGWEARYDFLEGARAIIEGYRAAH
jgi:UDP-glucose 4-epimerase